MPALPVQDAPDREQPRDSGIEFDHVSFSYRTQKVDTGAAAGADAAEGGGAQGAPLALDDVSFRIPARTTCAIVGASGSGKSTIAHLIARFWDVDAGSVRIGGADVRRMAPDDLMAQMSLVFQDVHLFRESIAANIARGRAGATREEVEAAARAAQADGFIRALPQGYDTMIGAEGVHLSGGERQRISIARAIVADAPIVVLDEATAFSDPENEHLIQQALARLMRGKTVVMIAHRLSTVVGARQIIVMDGGRVAQQGTHEELLAKEGPYRRMWRRYTQAVSWQIGNEGGGAAPAVGAPRRRRGSMADKPLIQRSFGLTDDAYRDLKGSALACTVTNLSLMIPFVVTVAAFGCILDALTGRPLDANALWWLCGAGAVGLVAVFLAARHDYRKTYLSAYTQSERVRLDLADHLRKLPMSFFNRRGVSDVAESIMGDVTGLESMLSSTLPQLIAGCASTVIVCALLALFDWRLALCVVVTLPLAFGIVLGGRARERRLFERPERRAARGGWRRCRVRGEHQGHPGVPHGGPGRQGAGGARSRR